MSQKPLRIKPISSAPAEHITTNIIKNMELIPTWFERCNQHDKPAVIFSAGPSLGAYLDKIKDDPDFFNDHLTICVKHALPEFTKRGLKPHFCSVLDPRSIHEVSTIGKKRSDLYEQAHPDTVFIVASMTDYSVTEWLIEHNKKLIGYHTATPEINSLDPETRAKVGSMIISGGTSSATRSIELAHFLGCSKTTLVGFDSSFDSPRPTNIVDSQGKQLYLKVQVGDGSYYTTGEFVAQAQDIQALLTNPRAFTSIVLQKGLTTSLVDAIEREVGNATSSTKQWRDFLDV